MRAALDTLARSPVHLLLSGEPGSGKHEWVEALAHHAASGGAPVPVLRLHGKAEEQVESVFFPTDEDDPHLPSGTIVHLEAPDALSRPFQQRLAIRLQQIGEPSLRVIASTVDNPEDLVRRGRLLGTLHVALSVVHLHMPSLRDRQQDVGPIVEQWLAHRNGTNGSAPPLDAEVVLVLTEQPWPGNIRELLHVVAIAAAESPGHRPTLARVRATLATHERDLRAPDVRPLARVEADYIATALERCGGNRALTARRLGIGRSTLIRKLKTIATALNASSRSSSRR
jgi:DNA-binding NtrC family response regulator